MNPHLVSALRALNIAAENYESSTDFQALPGNATSIIWNKLEEAPYYLNVFELGALQNARCSAQASSGVYSLRKLLFWRRASNKPVYGIRYLILITYYV